MTIGSNRGLAVVLAGLFAATAVSGSVAVYLVRSHKPPASDAAKAPAVPGLYCDFYDFTHASVVVSFDFAVTPETAPPRFVLRAKVEPDGSRETYEGDDRPAWAYALDDGTATIAAPDGATTIVLYGMKPHAPGVFWTEAGVRSNRYRNLEGKCRQAHFDSATGQGDRPDRKDIP